MNIWTQKTQTHGHATTKTFSLKQLNNSKTGQSYSMFHKRYET